MGAGSGRWWGGILLFGFVFFIYFGGAGGGQVKLGLVPFAKEKHPG